MTSRDLRRHDTSAIGSRQDRFVSVGVISARQSGEVTSRRRAVMEDG
jgi:hypothetical protein